MVVAVGVAVVSWSGVVISGGVVIGAGVGGRRRRQHCRWGWGRRRRRRRTTPGLRVVVAAVVNAWAGVKVVRNVVDGTGGDEWCRLSSLRGGRGLR